MKITFYIIATNPAGEPYRATLLTIQLPPGTSEHAGIIFAAEQFQTKMKVAHWQDIAHGYQIDK